MNMALRSGEFASSSSSVSPSFQRPPLPVGAYNQFIRILGKADRLSDAFDVLDRMAVLGVQVNHETLEFVTNAAVKEVEFETRAVSMKTLPSGEEGARNEGGWGKGVGEVGGERTTGR